MRSPAFPIGATILKALEDALRVPSAGACALLIVDLDRFKEVNDTHGHLIGDELLKSAADRMRQIASKKGTVGRLGGDEFEIVVPAGRLPDQMKEMAEAIIRYVSIPYRIGERSLAIGSASVGIAFAERGETDPEELFRKADLALYRAKEKRGAAQQFEPKMAVCAANRQAPQPPTFAPPSTMAAWNSICSPSWPEAPSSSPAPRPW